MPNTDESGEDYPWFYSWLLSFLPANKIMKVGMMTGAVIDTLLFLLLIVVLMCLGQFEQLNFPHIYILAIIFAFKPHLTRITTGKVVPRPRPLAVLLGNMILLLLCYYIITDSLWAYGFAVILYTLLALTSKFAVQAIVSITIILGLYSGELEILLFSPISIAVSILISGGKTWINFVGQIRHSIVYWTRTYDFVRHKNHFYIPKSWSKREFRRALEMLSENAYILIPTGLPLCVLIILTWFHKADQYSGVVSLLFGKWIIAALLVSILTSVWKFKVFGQAERYMDFALIPYFVLGCITLNTYPPWVTTLVIAYGFIMYIIHLYVHYKVYGAPRESVERIVDGYRWFNNVPQKARVISIPYTLSRYGLINTSHIYPFTQGIPFSRRNEFELIFSRYPYPPYDLRGTISTYKIDYVVKGRKWVEDEIYQPLEKMVFQNEAVEIYDVRHLKDDPTSGILIK
jgi:hypothetical protein